MKSFLYFREYQYLIAAASCIAQRLILVAMVTA